MTRLLRHLLLASLLMGLLSPWLSARGQGIVSDGRHTREARVGRHDPSSHGMAEERQRTLFPTARTTGGNSSVSSTDPTPVTPTHGSKPGRQMGEWDNTESFHLYKYAILLSRHSSLSHGAAAVSPRLYYVIALRHILC